MRTKEDELERVLRGVHKTLSDIKSRTGDSQTLNLMDARHRIYVINVALTTLINIIAKNLNEKEGDDA